MAWPFASEAPMIKRTMDPAFLTEVANHPEVRPALGGPPDIAPVMHELVGNPANIAIEGEHGGWVLQQLEHGTYEIHTLFLKEGRGPKFFAGARAMLRYVFTRTDALEIVTKCPDDNDGARMAAVKVGFRDRFRREAPAWAPGVGISYMALNIDGWFIRDDEALARGHRFHEELEEAKAAKGSALPTHPDDEVHDRAAGAALLMLEAGLTAKAVGFYNRFALVSGYRPVQMIAQNVVDVGDAIIEVHTDGMRVLLMR